MASATNLGRLERVELKAVWAHEAHNFTPWMAEEENLRLLGEAIGLELGLEAQEQNVGPYRADLLCKDIASDHWVLIENQIEKTDHGHLGQLLTYAAGLSAVTIVWVAKTFTEEHRAALDWLNEVTSEEIAFFGLEVELWRIGDSPPAPKFNVVSRPNAFVKRQVAGRSQASGQSSAFYEKYWTTFCDRLKSQKSWFKPRSSSSGTWLGWSTGRSPFSYTALISKPQNRVIARVSMLGPNAKEGWAALQPHRSSLDASLPGLVWDERPEGVESYISLHLDDADPNDRDDWPRQHAWLLEMLELLHHTFAPLLRQLP